MTPYRLFNILAGIVLACVIAASLVIVGSQLDSFDNHRAEWAESTALADAQKSAQRAARTERAAAQLCVRLRGPNAGYRWDADNKLHCTDNRGSSVRMAAAEGGTP